jgi:N-acyl-D-aspartate/D-glutamate deacylase
MLDLAIKSGLIVDGSGLPPYRGDVGIAAGRIVSVGRPAPEAARVLDVRGQVIAPGFIDPHTHFDAQLCWDPQARPSLEHGVTSVVPGNCSLSLAPLRKDQRGRFSRMFRQIEEMPEAAFDDGIDWRWGERFEAWVESLAKGLAINVAPLVGHSSIRLYVMGEDAAQRLARADELRAMQDVLRGCLDAGAVGLSTSFIDIDENLQPVPSRFADKSELDALSAVLGERGKILQVVHEFFDTELTIARVEQLAALSLPHGIQTTFSPLFHNRAFPDMGERVMAASRRPGRRGPGCGRRCRRGRSTSASRWRSAACCSSPCRAGTRSCRCPARPRSSPPSPTPSCGGASWPKRRCRPRSRRRWAATGRARSCARWRSKGTVPSRGAGSGRLRPSWASRRSRR